MISDELIQELVKQLDEEEEIRQEGRYYHWTYYSFILLLATKPVNYPTSPVETYSRGKKSKVSFLKLFF
jgi:hypothetical protein